MSQDRIYVPHHFTPYCGNCFDENKQHIPLNEVPRDKLPEKAQPLFHQLYHDKKEQENKNFGMISTYECPKCHHQTIMDIIGDVYIGEVHPDGHYHYDIPETRMG